MPARLSIAWLALVMGVAAWRCGGLATAGTISAQGRPNMVVILVDDLGYADLAIQGNTELATPHIDAIAREGVRCTSGYVSGPYCSPTRAGLLTGKYQQRFGHEFNPALLRAGGAGQGLPPGEMTLADRLAAAGYATGLIGKWHLGEEPAFHPRNRGFTEFFGFLTGAHSYFVSDDAQYGPIVDDRRPVPVEGYLTDQLADRAVAFIDRHKDRPFFLYLAFNAVHTPMQAPPSLIDRFATTPDPRRRTYLAMLAALDAAVGRVTAKLRDAGLDERTLVVFLSDNGGPTTKFAANGARNTPLRGSKGDTFEGGIRVPLFVKWTGRLPAGREYDLPVIQLDIAATALAAAGLPADVSANLDGVDLLPYLDGSKAEPPHEALYWRFGRQMAIRRGDWKLVRSSLGDREYVDVPIAPMLFNLKTDIGERQDLAASEPAKVQELQALWDRWNATLIPPRWPATLRGQPFPEASAP